MQDSYAAGLVDGEGYIGIMRIKAADTYAIRVAVGMVTKGSPILSSMQARYGGRLNGMKPETERNAPKTRWVVEGDEASAFLSAILPHLILKAEQATICLELHDELQASRSARGRHHWTDQLRTRAEIAKRRIHDLNARGPAVPEPSLPPGVPMAVYRWGAWWEPNDDLFGPVEFTGRLPTSGKMVAGHVYQTADPDWTAAPGPEMIPTPLASDAGPRGGTTGYGLRDWSRALLPTPTASDRFGAGEHGEGGQDLRTTITLLPTPVATDAKGARNAT